MLGTFCLGAALVFGLPGDDPAAEVAALAEYNGMKDRAAMTADEQWKLALWCEEHGLEAESKAHLAYVVQLDPKREAAWKRLGCKKYRGRWMNDEQIAEAKVQEEADERWGKEFKGIHRHIHGGRRKAEAEAALARITDPRAVPALYREFGDRSPTDQRILVQVLGQVDGPIASKTLATLAIYGVSDEVRRRATETLRGREPEDYAELLVALMPELLKYEVRPVGGPGSPGVLFVEGARYSVRRFYAPPPPPNVGFAPGDIISYDAQGFPLILRPGQTLGSADHGEMIGGKPYRVTESQQLTYAISPRQLAGEALKAAATASQQLENDLAEVEAMNELRTMFRSVVARVLRDATGQPLGEEVEPWKEWVGRLHGYERERPERGPKPVYDEVVPLAYKPYYGPAFNQVMFLRQAVPDS
jgi:hypothetical protein